MNKWKTRLLFLLIVFSLFILVGCTDITVIPDDKDIYTITVDYDNGSDLVTYTIESGAKINRPAEQTKEGYTFIGWYKGEAEYDFNKEVVSDIKIVAKWAEKNKTHSITYVVDGEDNVEVRDYAENQSVKKYVPEKEGYKFIGWFEEVNNVVSETEFDFLEFLITKDIKLVAKWQVIMLTVSFDSDGGSKVSPIKVAYGDTFVQTIPTKEGYEFDCWTYIEGEGVELTYVNAPITKDITFKAKWIEISNYFAYLTNEVSTALAEVDIYDYELPTSYNGLTDIAWTSTYPDYLVNGEFIRPYQALTVTLTLEAYEKGNKKTETFEITLPGYKLSTATTVASTYIYRNFDKMTDDLFETMDIIYCAFGTIGEDGIIADNTTLQKINTNIIPRAKENGVYVVLSLATDNEIWTTTMNPVNNLVDTVVNSAVQLTNKYGLDGIDIDWERPKSGQQTWFTNFAQKLNTAIKGIDEGKLVTAAITGGMWQIESYDIANSIQYLDYVNMMTYGMESSAKHYQNALYASSGTTTSCSIDESITIFNNKGVASSKILVGLAFYGIKQTKVDGTWGNSKSVLYDNLVSTYLSDKTNYIEYYDETAGVPYIMSSDGNTFISYDNEKSIKQKCAYVITKGIGGVMAWEAGCDTSMALVKAVKEGLNK